MPKLLKNMLKKVSFIIAIIGISLLVVSLVFPAVKVEDLSGSEINSKVKFSGVVSDERDFGDFKIFKLEGNDFEVVCDGCGDISYLDQNVRVEGIVDEFRGERQVRVLKISISD